MNTTTDRCETHQPVCQGFLSTGQNIVVNPCPPVFLGLIMIMTKMLYSEQWLLIPFAPRIPFINGTADLCEGALQCSAGATYNNVTKQCEAVPTCSSGVLKYTIFGWLSDAPHISLLIVISCDCIHSHLRYRDILDTTLDMCTAAVQCPATTYFNFYTQWCETSPTCPPNATYYPSLGTCITKLIRGSL